MKNAMTLWNLVLAAEKQALEKVPIYARKPWLPESEAELVAVDDECRIEPSIAENLRSRELVYFLEVPIVHENLAAYTEAKSRTPEEKFRFTVHYAENDSFPDE